MHASRRMGRRGKRIRRRGRKLEKRRRKEEKRRRRKHEWKSNIGQRTRQWVKRGSRGKSV